jgi:hypothetical protein
VAQHSWGTKPPTKLHALSSMFHAGTLAALFVLLSSSAVLAESVSPMDLPFEVVKARLAKLFHCQWVGPTSPVVCPVSEIGGNVDLFPREADGAVEGVEMNALLADVPRNSRNERKSLETAERIVQSLLPAWKDRHSWLKNAFQAAYRDERSQTKTGNVNIFITPFNGADFEQTYIEVLLIQGDTIDKHKYGWPTFLPPDHP